MTSTCTHPLGQQRAISDYEVRRDTIDGRKEWIPEEVVCDACGQHRRIRTQLTKDSGPESGIYRRCPDCGVRVFTTARDGALGPHRCAAHT